MRAGLTSVLVLMIAAGCSSSANTPPTNADAGSDVASGGSDVPRADAGRADAGRSDAGTADAGPSRAGLTCTDDSECGSVLTCDITVPGGICFGECTDNANQVREREQCGGAGSTCLTFGDGTDATSSCARVCTPTARAGTANACREGQVCTGWAYTHQGSQPDSVGCDLFCTANSHCGSGQCNLRTGDCGAAADLTARADGEPCDPTVTSGEPAQNRQCRGICFQVTDVATQGQCGSLINVTVTPRCPDDSTHIAPDISRDDAGENADNVGLCLFKTCATNADCTAPLTCVPGMGGAPSQCEYP
jgi:hypothetical protein